MLQYFSMLQDDYKPAFIGRDASYGYVEVHGVFRKSLFWTQSTWPCLPFELCIFQMSSGFQGWF